MPLFIKIFNFMISYLSGVDCTLKIREFESCLNIPAAQICGIVPDYMNKDKNNRMCEKAGMNLTMQLPFNYDSFKAFRIII